MTGISTGVFKKLAIKRQTSLGAIATAGAAGSAQYMRRVTSTIDLTKTAYESQEIKESQQVSDSRHGVRKVEGSVSGELHVGGYKEPWASVLRKDPVETSNLASLSTLSTASTEGVGKGVGTLQRSSGSFLTSGLKIGDVISLAGYTTTATANNGRRMIITNMTTTVLTVVTIDREPIVAKGAGDPIVISVPGKKVWVPQTGHLRLYHTVEHWFSDIDQSEVFVDTVFTGANVQLPPTGMATIEFPAMGLDMQTGETEYFTSPAASPTGGNLASVNGVLSVGGVIAGLVTGMNISVAGNHSSPGGVVGSNVDPDIFPGVLKVTGQLTVLFKDAVYRDMFINETESSIVAVLTANNDKDSDFTSFVLPRVKYNGATKDDGQAGLSLTMPFVGLEHVGDGQANHQTSISIQDSQF
jgi:hypothetical protein